MKFKELVEKYGEKELTEEALDQLERLLKPIGRWKPINNEMYYYVLSNGEFIDIAKWNNYCADNYRYSIHNVFKTKEEAERSLEIHNALYEASLEPDWSDVKQDKYAFYVSLEYHNKIKIFKSNLFYYGFPYYFPTQEIAQELLERFGEEDIKKYVLHVYD